MLHSNSLVARTGTSLSVVTLTAQIYSGSQVQSPHVPMIDQRKRSWLKCTWDTTWPRSMNSPHNEEVTWTSSSQLTSLSPKLQSTFLTFQTMMLFSLTRTSDHAGGNRHQGVFTLGKWSGKEWRQLPPNCLRSCRKCTSQPVMQRCYRQHARMTYCLQQTSMSEPQPAHQDTLYTG